MGASGHDGQSRDEGAAYVFEEQTNGTWAEEANLNASDPGEYHRFGRSVAIDDDTVIVGEPRGDSAGTDDTGAAYVFVRNESGSWEQQAKLTASDGAAFDSFGGAVAVDSDTALVGAYRDDAPNGDEGAAYVFTRDADGTWSEQAKLTASDSGTNDGLGISVAIDGDKAFVGAYRHDAPNGDEGAAYVFTRDADGTWSEQAKLTASDPDANDYFGRSVSLSDDVALIGASGDAVSGGSRGGGSNTGAAYIFEEDSGGNWVETDRIFADDRVAGDTFGSSIVVDGDTGLIGARRHDSIGGRNSGAAYVFSLGTNEPPLPDFSFTPISPTTADGIEFTDESSDSDGSVIAWHWDFDDGNTSTDQHPNHSYADDGTYNVTLTVEDNDHTLDSITQSLSVENAPPEVGFSFTPDDPSTADTVDFVDNSSDSDGSITSWSWDFGDGNTSTGQHPNHTYPDNGTYTVTLTVTDDDGGSNTTSRTVTVSNIGPSVDFSLSPTEPSTADTVDFVDNSSDSDGSITSWSWDFGDGNTSTKQHPNHTYADNGTYTVTLTVTDDDGNTSATTTTITVSNVAPTVDFSFSPTEPSTADTVDFSDQSSDSDGAIVSWSWEFGNGNTSTAENPSHSYADDGTYTVTLTVTDDDGATNTTSATISVANVAPSVNFTFSPSSPSTAEEIDFTDNSSDSDGSIASWNWEFGDRTTSTEQHPNHSYPDDGTFTVNLTVTDDDGETNTTSQTVTVSNGAPSVDFAFSPSSPSSEDTVDFTDQSTDRDGSIASWSWEFGDGNTSTAENPSHSYADDGTYTVMLTITDDDGATNTTKATISVSNVAPSVDFGFSPSDPSTANPVNFTDLSSDSDGSIVSWSWEFGDGNTSTAENPSHSYADDGSYTVNLTVTDDDGVTNTTSRTIPVSNVAPSVDLAFSPSSPSTADTVDFTDQSTDSDGTVAAWFWDFGDGYTTTAQHPNHSYADAGTYTVNLTVTDNDGATNSTNQTVTVSNVAPSVDFTFSPSSPSTGDTVDFTDLSSDSDGTIAAWSWDFGDGDTSTAQHPNHSYADDGNYTVTLTVTDDDGATNTTSATISVANAAPSADLTFSPSSPSTADTVDFADRSSDGDGSIVSWSWDFGDANTSIAENPSHSYADDGTYTVTLTVTDDDGATNTTSQTVTVSNGAPSVNFTFSPSTPSTADTINFTDQSSDGDGSIVSWSWDFGDGNTSTAENPSHSYADGGTYIVNLTVTDDDGATNSKKTQLTVTHLAPSAEFTHSPEEPTTEDEVQFEDQSSHPNAPTDSIVSWHWDFGDGNTSTAQHPDHSYADDGNYTVTLTVTDDDGVTNTTDATISVANVAPTVDFGFSPSDPSTADTVDFTDQSSDSDGSIASWSWEFGDGKSSTAENPSHSYADDGTFTVNLTVTDDDGVTNTTSQTISVLNVAPSVDFTFSPSDPSTADTIDFTDQSSDSDGTVETWSWELGDGNTSTAENPSHSYADDGNYTVTLTVTDDDGATSTTSATIRVANAAPSVDFGFSPSDPSTADTVNFTDQSTDSDGTVETWSWEFGDGDTSTAQHPNHSYADDGNYSVTLTVTDDDGAQAEMTREVVIANVPPNASNASATSPQTVGFPVRFDATDAVDPDGQIVAYEWRRSGQVVSTSPSFETTFDDVGRYCRTVEVTDDDGDAATAQVCARVVNRLNVSVAMTQSTFGLQDEARGTVRVETLRGTPLEDATAMIHVRYDPGNPTVRELIRETGCGSWDTVASTAYDGEVLFEVPRGTRRCTDAGGALELPTTHPDAEYRVMVEAFRAGPQGEAETTYQVRALG